MISSPGSEGPPSLDHQAAERLREVEYRGKENHQGEKTKGAPGSRHAERVAAGVFCERERDRDTSRDQSGRKTRE